MERQIEIFIDTYAKEIESENAAIFAGAGLSVGAGFVNWQELMKPVAHELGLDVALEHDLISIAQYHFNEKQSRHELNKILIEQFARGHKATENHTILGRLPIRTYWTTNYDRVIEDTLKTLGRIPDTKYTLDQLKLTKPKRDAVVYKLHGDIEHPDDAVLTKDDYEHFNSTRGPFVTALSGDLVSKTFLFIGFGFTDPNLDYILSRVRISLHSKPRTHYCIFKKCERPAYTSEESFRYAELKQHLAINDLKRFGIQTLLVEDYGHITLILRKIEKRFRCNAVFISGSAYDYGHFNQSESEHFVYNLSRRLIAKGYKIVSGFGFGIGGHVISGALQQIYEEHGEKLHDQLMLRPFPQGVGTQKQWEIYRQDMISYAGIALFIFGNKSENGKTVDAIGVRQEFEIAKNKGLILLPIGATGFISAELWNEVFSDFMAFYPGASDDFKRAFKSLNDTSKNLDSHLGTILMLLEMLKKI
ncbi:MAG TPA: SIR2 family protein [Verrucomicrobiae bacterium]|jgi:hypothetical protein|nr:SIR2 family protein [Verrucomicrobiae bacterium]